MIMFKKIVMINEKIKYKIIIIIIFVFGESTTCGSCTLVTWG